MELETTRTQQPWVERLRLQEFRTLNAAWADDVETVEDAVAAMTREGVARLAPVAFDLEFDPEYYREVHPEYADLADPDVYARWLSQDVANDWPPSPKKHLEMIGLSLPAYPEEEFDWRNYIALKPSAGPNRWSALEDVVRGGGEAHPDLNDTLKGGGRLLEALGDHLSGRDEDRAAAAYRASIAAGNDTVSVRHHLADALFRLEDWEAALAGFQSAAALSGAGFWTFVNGARAANKLQRFDDAFAMLALGKDRVAGEPGWRVVLQETIEAEFEAAKAAALHLLVEDRRREADAALEQAVTRAAARWAEHDPLGAPLRAGDDGRVVMLANKDLRQCTHYRVEQKEQLFARLGRPLQVFDMWTEVDAFISALPGAALAIFYRVPAFPSQLRAIEIARVMGVPTLYDIDDLIFEPEHYPEPLSTYGGSVTAEFYHSLQLGPPLFRAAMRRCDYGMASTTDLARHMRPVVRSGLVYVLPNGIDDRNAWMLEQPPSKLRRDEGLVVFYGSGTKAHNQDFLDLAGPALLSAFAGRADLRLVTVGHLELDARFDPFRDRIREIPWTPDVRAYWSLLAEADVNIAVLAPYATTDAKSEIKWLEAALCGVPSLVSGTHRYREVLEDGVDVLMADDAATWTQKLGALIENSALRAELVTKAREKAAREYSAEENARRLGEILELIAADHAVPARPKRKRVLLLNIFFPPQTIGGSTRVVRDNLDDWLQAGDQHDFEFAVVTSDNNADQPNRLRVEDYRGAPVFRISTPREVNMEWRPFNPDIGAIFRQILQAWRPDLVHFHCVQRMTGSVIEEALAAGVPYLVTLHDAWYVSDWHFLADVEGRVLPPCEDFPVVTPVNVSTGESLDRRRRLRAMLEGAETVLGVSRAFTDLHHACGFEQVRAVPNGAPPMERSPRTVSSSGRVRLAHVGSQTAHKGYHLVQAALRQSDLPNLELTVIDHGRRDGRIETVVWGSTLVRIVGAQPQERMHEFYAGQDVLLAPSLWPESFGLVSREALAQGLWVVASDRGAMGEDVTPGVNGWVVDVSSPGPLIEVLTEINADPHRYLRSPPELPLRTMADQSRELLDIYRELLASGEPNASAAASLREIRRGRPRQG